MTSIILKKFSLGLCTTLFILFTFSTWAGNLSAQSTAGSIAGTVKDSNGAVIPDAVITITNPATKLMRSATSTSDGGFSVPQLPPGTYIISVDKTGFKHAEKTNVILSAADRLNAGDFILETGSIEETVSVTAEASQLQIKSESGERSDLITNRQIKDLALNGRNLLDLLKTVPGVNSTVSGQVSGPGGFSNFNINGTRSNQHELSIDGSSNVDTGSNSTIHVTINPDAIAEVKILTSNFQAEYGKAAGGFISYVTKSGTSEFHGGGRYFHRHEGLNANNFLRNAQGLNADGTEAQPRTLYRYNYFGYDIGGPVYIPGLKFNENKDKLFFYFNQEYIRQLVPATARNIRVPTAAERNGDFSESRDGNGNLIIITDPLTGQPFPGNIIPPDRFSSDGQAILNLYPLPNVGGDPGFNFTSSNSSEYPRREDVIRIDYNISDRTRLSGRYINNNDNQLLPYGTFNSDINFPLTRFVFPQSGRNGVLTLTHTFSPTLTNEFIFGPSMNRLSITAEDNNATNAAHNLSLPVLFPNTNPDDFIPNFGFGGINNVVGTPTTNFNGLPFRNVNNTFNFIDNVTKVVGVHTLKAGLYIQRSQKNQTSTSIVNSTIDFSSTNTNNPGNTGYSYANALLGNFTTFSQASQTLTGLYRYTNAEFYLQDTWRVTRRLTLDYGMRFSYYQPQYDEALQTGVFNPDLFDPNQAVRLYLPTCDGGVFPCSSGEAAANLRAFDPANPSLLLSANLIGTIVPNSGDLANGIGRADEGYPRGGFESRGLLFEPRFGFALDLFGDGKTVMRGGFGISHDRVQGNLVFDQINAPPTVTTPTLFFGNLDNLATDSGVLAPQNVIGYARDGNIPTVYSYSLGIQRDIGFNTVIDVAYVGTLSRHLSQQRNLNAIAYGTTFTQAAQDPTRAGLVNGTIPPEVGLPAAYVQAGLSFSGANALNVDFLRPFQGYGDILYREFVGSANYNSLQVAVNRRFSAGLTFGLAYTWSKAFDSTSGDTNFVNPFDTRLYNYRLSEFDREHIFILNYVYELPKIGKYLGDNAITRGIFDNWQISGISQFSTGTPLSLGVGASFSAGQQITGSQTEGPRFTLKDEPQIDQNGLFIDPNAFVLPAVGSVGLGPLQYLHNPGVNNHDISLFKNFPLGGAEGTRYLQFRFEMFNAFNHTQFSSFNTGTLLVVPTGNGFSSSATDLFNNYTQALITNNLRSQASPELQQTSPTGTFFGEYNSARDPRIIQLGIKLYF